MKKYFKGLLLAVSVVALSMTAVSCDDGDDNERRLDGTDEEFEAVLKSYIDYTIKPTYQGLAEAALVMRTANEALKAAPSDATMKAAADAWMDARIKWEISEAFLFGPVGEDGFDIDGHIDSWPLELEDIKKEIAKGTITGSQAWQKEGEVIGFHVTEYLLFRDGKARPVADLTENELSYLTAATDALVWDCVLAYVAWIGEANVSAEMKAVFNENPDVVAHLNDSPHYMNFAQKLASATGYSSWAKAMSQISSGAEDIAAEVGTTKIAEPYDEKNVLKVESWYSWHSLDDYVNNIESIKNAYLGGMGDNSRPAVSLSTFIRSKDASLDAQVKAQIADCIAKIRAMGNNGQYSFYKVVRDQINKAQVTAAVDACNDLAELFKYIKDNVY